MRRPRWRRGGVREALRSAEARKTLAESILQKRDRYIAGRINGTLAQGETGILFLGMLHVVKPHLDADITVIDPIPSRGSR